MYTNFYQKQVGPFLAHPVYKISTFCRSRISITKFALAGTGVFKNQRGLIKTVAKFYSFIPYQHYSFDIILLSLLQ